MSVPAPVVVPDSGEHRLGGRLRGGLGGAGLAPAPAPGGSGGGRRGGLFGHGGGPIVLRFLRLQAVGLGGRIGAGLFGERVGPVVGRGRASAGSFLSVMVGASFESES